jgi:hypothetical protein
MEPGDDKFRELFSQQREEDYRHLPPFDAIARSSSQIARPTISKRQLAAGLIAASAMLVVAATVVSQLRHRSFEKEMRQWALVSQWAAASDSFLSHPQPTLNENITDSFLNLQTQEFSSPENQ